MKKICIILLAAIAMVSCGHNYTAKKVSLSDVNDSVNYALGLVNGYQLKMMYLQSDSSKAVINEFIEALERGYEGKVEQLSEIATVGQQIGMAIKSAEKTGLADNPSWDLNEPIFFQGVVNGLYGSEEVLEVGFAREYFQTAYAASQPDADKPAGAVKKAKCPTAVKNIQLVTPMDTLNYAFGLLNGNEVKQYLLANDSTGDLKKEFIANINKGLKSRVHNSQLVKMGEEIGKNIKAQESAGLIGVEQLVTDFELIKQGFINGMNGFYEQLNGNQAGEYIQSTISNLRYGANKEAGERFLAENALKDGIKVTDSGLQYEVLKMGKGKKPTALDKVKVHYHGTLIDGTVFDSSVDRGEPITFGLSQVIAGWTEGLQLMPVGSKFRFYIPQELGYGAREAGKIPPYSTLIFEVELLGIEK